MESLLAVTNPSDIYAHAGFDGHLDHAKLTSSLTAAMIRRGTNAWLHTTLIHPEGTGGCQIQSAALWPNPTLASVNGNPFARFTPSLPFTAPTVPGCDPDATPTGSSWGPDGPPNEIVPVPAADAGRHGGGEPEVAGHLALRDADRLQPSSPTTTSTAATCARS